VITVLWVDMHFLKTMKSALKTMCGSTSLRGSLFIIIALLMALSGPFSLMGIMVSAKNSAKVFSSDESSNIPQIRMIYDSKAYEMSTFVLANGGEMKKITFPSASPPDDGSNPPLHIQLGSTVHFEFNEEPTKVSAYLIDMQAQPVELYTQRQIGPSDFQIVGPEGILNYGLHAFFPDGSYVSKYLLVNVTSGASPTVRNLDVGSSGTGYIALSDRKDCINADRLPALQVSAKSQNSNSSSPMTLLDNNLQTVWTVQSMDAKSFVKSTSTDDQKLADTSKSSPWLQLDLGADKIVCNIGIAFPDGDKSINFFRVQTSADGKHFIDVGSAESYPLDAGGQLFTFPDMPKEVRYVRISDIGNIVSGQTQIAELMAAGK
jgi:F5/8 type C domain